MDRGELIKHKKDLISIYTKNLQILEVRRAKEGAMADVGVINQIENVSEMIALLQGEIDTLSSANKSDHAYIIKPVVSTLQKYDNFITKFAEEIKAWNGDSNRYLPTILNSFRRALDSKHVFIGHFVDDQWQIIAEREEISAEISTLTVQDPAFRELLLQASTKKGLQIGTLANASKNILILPFGKKDDVHLLVFYEFRFDFDFDTAFDLILQTIIDCTANFGDPKTSEYLESAIYNQLKIQYGFVSDFMYNRQFYLFNQRLEQMTVFFEPIIFLNPTAPSIFGWEALARDKDTGRAPADLFQTVEQWGVRFQLQLDIYFLHKATSTYVIDAADPSGKRIQRKDQILPLSVNVYPESLIRTRYYDAVKQIENIGRMPLNRLYLEISEKSKIPVIEGADNKLHSVESFREFLYRFRDLDIHFSIDDFGVGYASSSRLARLGPASIKVDRDALLDTYGNFTLEYVIRLARRMPGEMRVIVEGYDEESRFSLRKLYDLGVRYIQGHKYGTARPQIDNRLPADIVKQIREALS